MTADEAFLAYEAVRHRLPAATLPKRKTQYVSTLADIADLFDVFLLDAFGVLNIGETAIPGARDRVEAFRSAGKRVLVVSNAASVPSADLVGKYARLGFDFPAGDIITSRSALVSGLADRDHLHWGAMIPSGGVLDDLGCPRLSILEDDPALYDAVDGFLLVGSGAWTDRRQDLLEQALLRKPRPVLVANPDIVAPREDGFSREPGHFAHRLADISGAELEFFGKPFDNIYALAFARLGSCDTSRIVMVGDSLHTDILGAQEAGVASALISGFGFFAGMDVHAAVQRARIFPDFVIDRP